MEETENKIIRLFFSGRPESARDDVAFYPAPGNGARQVLATDAMVEGTHFRRDWSTPEDIARKLVVANTSDFYASGARPRRALLNLGLPPELARDRPFLEPLARALVKALEVAGVELVGGDTFRSGELHLSLCLQGEAAVEPPLARSDFRPGQELWLTGPVGWSYWGYQALSGSPNLPSGLSSDWWHRARMTHLSPRGLTEPEKWLKFLGRYREVLGGGIDISDGPRADLGRILSLVGGRARLELEELAERVLPAGMSETSAREILAGCLLSGEEYQTLFGLEPLHPRAKEARHAARQRGYFRLGRLLTPDEMEREPAKGVGGPGFWWRREDLVSVLVTGRGFDHFASLQNGKDGKKDRG